MENGVTTIYIGNYYEVYDPGGANEEVTKYYYASGKRIAMREGNALYWIHRDHLGSTVVVTDDQGQKEGKQKYYPYGSGRGQSGTITWLAILEHNYHPRIYRYSEEVMILHVGDGEPDFNYPKRVFSIWWQSRARNVTVWPR